MKYVDEFRDNTIAQGLIEEIQKTMDGVGPLTLMEVCGTHTMAIFRYGIKDLLPDNIELLSGPGCPVCVTENSYLDRAIAYSKINDVIVATFGDMMRVPGSSSSLEKAKASGRDVRVVYSTLDALKIARDNPQNRVVFLGVGFETTSPTTGVCILEAERLNLRNFFVLSGHKLIPPAIRVLLNGRNAKIDGFISPGHVSTIIGKRPYEFISSEYGLSCVIAGFEPLDILQAIYMLVVQIKKKSPSIEIQYKRSVAEEGNPRALGLMEEVFVAEGSEWRGIGRIPASGLGIRERFNRFDAKSNIDVEVEATKENKACICGEILQGKKRPTECALFGKACTPEDPLGACMVSSEGTCAAYYKYQTVNV